MKTLSALVVVAFACICPIVAGYATQSSIVAFVGASVVDLTSGRASSPSTVISRDGRIEAVGPVADVTVPQGATRVDLTGKFLLPGFVAAHVHVSDVNGLAPRAYTVGNTRRQLGVYARYGITSVLSLGGEQAPAFAERARQATPGFAYSRLALAGDVLNPPTPEASRADVARMADLRVDWIKIRVDDNLGATRKMAPDVYRAVIDAAHTRGLKVAAHIYYLDDAKALLRAGVDMIAHSVRDRALDDEFLGLMKARNVPYCPTLTREVSTFVYESTPAFFDDPFFLREADNAVVAQLREPARQRAMASSTSAQAYKAALPTALANVKRATDAGLLVVMGTDSGAFPERFQGYFEHLEMTMMAEAGLTPAQVLRAATIDAARGAALPDVGVIQTGAWADLVAIARNPLDDIRNTRSIHGVWIGAARVGSSR